MSLAELRLEDLRCLRQAHLLLEPRLNLISGENGSGKTSLLEAIYLLGRGRSFRTRHTEQLIRHSAQRLWVHGRTAPEPAHTIGIECNRDHEIQIRIDRMNVHSRAKLSELFPVQIIDPGIHRLIEEGPAQRRRWLDWAVFHVEPDFLSHWQAYMRALKQRNAALQSGAQASTWETELVRHGEILTAARLRLVNALQPHWCAMRDRLGAVAASMSFFQGWAPSATLAQSLERHRSRDQERGLTSLGPHRFEVLLRLQGRPVRELVSRGQQKLLGIALALAMTRHIAEVSARTPSLLLDDPAAELDASRTQALLSAVRTLGAQLVVTALRPEDISIDIPEAVFHVEQGQIKRL